MTPRQIIEEVRSETFRDASGHTGKVELAPPLAPAEIDQFERQQPEPLPSTIRDLLGLAGGFTLLGEHVDFRGQIQSEFEPPFTCGLPIYTDGFGSFWTAHIAPDTGDWSPIFFVSPDPPVIVVQSRDLADFLVELFNRFRPGEASALDQVYALSLDIWSQDRGIHRAAELRNCADPVLEAFASGLQDEDLIADLRERTIGSGFT